MKFGILLVLFGALTVGGFAADLSNCGVLIGASGCASNTLSANGLLPDGNWAAALFSSGTAQTSTINTSPTTSTLFSNSNGLSGVNNSVTTPQNNGLTSVFTTTTLNTTSNFNTGLTSLFGLGGGNSNNPFLSGVSILNFGQQIAPSTTVTQQTTTNSLLNQGVTPTAAPEPSSILLMSAGLAGLIGIARKRKA